MNVKLRQSYGNESRVNALIEKLFEEDKQKHFWYSFWIVVLMLPFTSLFGAVLTSFFVGVGKEIWDHFYGSGFCWYDMLANAVGITLAACVTCLSGLLLW
ncbi:multipass membrane protein [Oleiphilus messinensis]|uniref:Multipass membrane protein n=1 Tax=Oleiphilus messinensis TaxID=141451 RepID=A0A1Y0I3B5_9GAMM|nr:hypothetical protein [Oleiphilus messinensis]ARU54998.1 multipass membrane protein [Oleiphilus messinensis]